MKLPVVSGFKVVKALGSIGFKITRQSGSHIIMKKDDTVVVVPKHKELAKGTLLSIISQSGLSRKEFLDLL